MKPKELLKIILAISLPFIFGPPFIFVSTDEMREIVSTLVMPSFTLPSWVFPMVWVYMYAGMGVAMWIIWDKVNTPARNAALRIYFIQLMLNLLWNLIFFYYGNVAWGLAVLIIMWFTIAVLIYKFYKLSPAAAYCLGLYFIWRTYSLPVVFSIWHLNK